MLVVDGENPHIVFWDNLQLLPNSQRMGFLYRGLPTIKLIEIAGKKFKLPSRLVRIGVLILNGIAMLLNSTLTLTFFWFCFLNRILRSGLVALNVLSLRLSMTNIYSHNTISYCLTQRTFSSEW